MASQGPLFTTSGNVTDDNAVGTSAWTNPSNGATTDAVYATVTGANFTSHYLKWLNFGFSIPAGSTINGISVDIIRHESGASVTDNVVKLVKGGTVGGNNKASASQWPTTDGTATYGSSNDLWGQTWTSADINGSTFGVVLSATSSGMPTASVDSAAVTVYYTPPPTVGEEEPPQMALTVEDVW